MPLWSAGLFMPNRRQIGGVVAQVTIQEREHDELMITEHPVEQGAHINDHAFKRPSEVTIRAGWSASGAGDLSANGSGVYALLLAWQAALEPFDLYTGKRVYHNMLIQSLIVTTDHTSEFALMADITCRQIILVRTQMAQTGISDKTDEHKDAEKTATGDSKGDQQTRNVGSGGGVAPPDPQGPGQINEFAGGPDPNRPQSAGGVNEFAGTGAPSPEPTTEGSMIEQTAGKNTTVEERARVTSPEAATQAAAVVSPFASGSLSPLANYQRLVRRQVWQRTSRSQPRAGVRSASG